MGHPLTRDELTFGLENIYVKKYNAINRRIDEKLKSGNIKITENGSIALTKQGENFIALSTKIAETLDIDKKYIDPVLIIKNRIYLGGCPILGQPPRVWLLVHDF